MVGDRARGARSLERLTACQNLPPSALQDAYDAPMTFSDQETDTMMLGLLRAVYSGKKDTQMVVSTEQAVPLHSSWLNFNRWAFLS